MAPNFDIIREGPISGITKAIYKTSVFVIESLKGLWGFIFNIGDLFKSLWNDDMDIDETRPVSIIGIVQFGAVTLDAGFNITLELLAYISVFVIYAGYVFCIKFEVIFSVFIKIFVLFIFYKRPKPV